MSQPAVNQRWRGVTRWQLDELDSLARLFGVSVAYLVSDNAPVPTIVAPPTGLEPATSGLRHSVRYVDTSGVVSDQVSAGKGAHAARI